MASQNGGGGGGRLTPNLDLESTRAHNLVVLQRSDASVEEILFTAAHVTVYDFSIDLNQWSRKDVEGPLFVVKRNAQPRFQFVVLNRRNAANLVENLLGDFEFELQVPYLLYRNASQEVNGIWFYNKQECEAAANLFNRIIGAFSKVPTKPKEPQSKSESEESESVSSMAMAEGPLEPPNSSTSTTASVPDNPSTGFHNGTGSNPLTPVPQQFFASGQPLVSTRIPALQTPAPLAVSTSVAPLRDTPESSTGINGNHAANLIKQSLFAPAVSATPLMMIPVQSSSIPTASTLQPSIPLQQTSVTPLLHPFPPPVPSASLNPVSNYGPVITKDKVRDALLRLAKSDQFVDMVYREILNAHYS